MMRGLRKLFSDLWCEITLHGPSVHWNVHDNPDCIYWVCPRCGKTLACFSKVSR